MNRLQHRAEELLSRADIHVNGGRPWDIQVHRQDFYSRVFWQGSLGLGESYMDGWWDCSALDQFFEHVLRARLEAISFPGWRALKLYLYSLFFNPQRRSRAFQIGEGHYDRGNALFEQMLDRRMVYTTALWDRAPDLDAAQEAKLDFVCRSLALERGMKVLDIGCGWGSFAKFAAEKYGANVVGITVSREQAELARELCQGLPVSIRLQDYRDLHEHFDGVVSLGMFEHVGLKNYRTYMEAVRQSLARCGRFYLSTIGKNHSVRLTDPWIEKYIFPNSMLPSIRQIGAAAEGLFVMENWQNWGDHYDRTLMAWLRNFENGWDRLRSLYDERFHRMWKFYLLASAGAFRARSLQVWQILFTPLGAGGC